MKALDEELSSSGASMLVSVSHASRFHIRRIN